MPGVYRDKDTFRYFPINDYEDRRRRDIDDQRAGRPPFGPRLSWQPGIRFAGVPAGSSTSRQPEPVVFDFDAFARSVNDGYQPPDASGILAVLNTSDTPEEHEWFDRLLESLPARAGQNPAFDALVDDADTTVLTTQELIARIN